MSVSHPIDQAADLGNAAVPTFPVWRLSVEKYHEMIRRGILTEDDPVELLDGWLVPKMPKNPAHRAATYQLRKTLEAAVPAGWYVDSQEPVTLAASEPEPDAVVVRGSSHDYRERHPGPADIALIVEIAGASLSHDRTTKKRLYAEAGIPQYWIVSLAERRVEVYADPTGPAASPDYRSARAYGASESLPLPLPGTSGGAISIAMMFS